MKRLIPLLFLLFLICCSGTTTPGQAAWSGQETTLEGDSAAACCLFPLIGSAILTILILQAKNQAINEEPEVYTYKLRHKNNWLYKRYVSNRPKEWRE